jgi:predicted nucleotidyltransferase
VKVARRAKTLAASLWPAAKRQVLGLLLAQPEREWHLREIARRTQLSPSAAQREVISLAEVGILERRVEARRAYYRANRGCPIFPELQGLVLKTVGLGDVVCEALSGVDGILLAFVYGSMAKGTADARSDVDVLVIADAPFADISAALLRAEKRLAREITPTVYSSEEFAARLKTKHHFLMRVLSEPKIMLIGTPDDLERMGGAAPE